LGISKFLLLFNLLLIGGLKAQTELVSSDRFLFKILDRAISFQDIVYQLRNVQALDCIYSDSLVVAYFEKSFIKELEQFVKKFPTTDDEVVKYLHKQTNVLSKLRHFLKILRYSEDQHKKISTGLTKIIREGTKENKCGADILHRDSLKTNFKSLIEMELYMRSRYEGQLRSNKRNFDFIRPSIDLFVDSLDKQFAHEYYW
jgi:hypothetical protein